MQVLTNALHQECGETYKRERVDELENSIEENMQKGKSGMVKVLTKQLESVRALVWDKPEDVEELAKWEALLRGAQRSR